jgi:hypothetical protein
MKVMLSSFGIGQNYFAGVIGVESSSVFGRLPPLSMQPSAPRLGPEYSLLALCDKLILDAASFDRLMQQPGPLYKTTGRAVKLLQDAGFLELIDYSAILRDNRKLLSRMTDNDLTSVSQWLKALTQSTAMWLEFLEVIQPMVNEALYLGNTRANASYQREFFTYFRQHPDRYLEYIGHAISADEEVEFTLYDTLRYYLTYVNANLILSNEIEAGLHDWADFSPFYRQKFLSVGQDIPGAAVEEAAQQLFDIAFPEFAIESPEHLVRLLKHRRVGELRALINEASTGAVTFDETFARSVFREVFGIERKLGKSQRIVGYLTLPIGFIPMVGNFAQLLLQEVAGTALERRLRKPYRWFYMLSDLASHDSGATAHGQSPGERDRE